MKTLDEKDTDIIGKALRFYYTHAKREDMIDALPEIRYENYIIQIETFEDKLNELIETIDNSPTIIVNG